MEILRNAHYKVLSELGRLIAPDTSEHYILREKAVEFLAMDTARENRGILLNLTQERVFWFKAMLGLAYLHDNRILPEVLDSLENGEFCNKIRAIHILSAYGDASIATNLLNLYQEMEVLKSQTQNEDSLKQIKAVQAIAIIGLGELKNNSSEIMSFLENIAQNGSYHFAMNAIETLGEIGDAQAAPVLREIMTREEKLNPYMRLACAKSLEKIGDGSEETLNAVSKSADLAKRDCLAEGMDTTFVVTQIRKIYEALK